MTFTADLYKLCCLDPEVKDIYVGSTRSFRQRKNMHKHNCNTPTDKAYNFYVYQFIREHGGFQNWSMISIFTGEFETKHEMHRKEREYIEELKASLNKQLPTRTMKERYLDNREEVLLKTKEYSITNSESIKIYKKQYYQNNSESTNCVCGGRYTQLNKKRHFKTKKHINFNPIPVHPEV
jgi:hypothetical protein